MKKERKMPLFRFMFLRTFTPSALLLVVCVIFFCVLIARSNSHNDQLRLIHQQELAQQRLSETEDAVLRIVYRQQEILNSKDFLKFTYLYDDLDWYNRYRLQNALHEDINSMYLQNTYVQEAWLYWPDNGRTISSAHAATSTPAWLANADWRKVAGFHKMDAGSSALRSETTRTPPKNRLSPFCWMKTRFGQACSTSLPTAICPRSNGMASHRRLRRTAGQWRLSSREKSCRCEFFIRNRMRKPISLCRMSCESPSALSW